MKTSVEVHPFGRRQNFKQVMIHHRLTLTLQAQFACDLMKSLAVAGIPEPVSNSNA